MREVIKPIHRLLLNVKTDALLAFLNTMSVTWSLAREEDGAFRAEIRLGDRVFEGWHQHIPHNALVHAVARFLVFAQLDFHEYKEVIDAG